MLIIFLQIIETLYILISTVCTSVSFVFFVCHIVISDKMTHAEVIKRV
jgi:hypothetical protein